MVISVLVINSSSSVIPLYMQTGFNEPYGIAYDSSNGHVYVANSGSNTLAVVNTSTNRVTQQIPIGQNSQPLLLLYNAYNKYLYAYDRGTGNDWYLIAIARSIGADFIITYDKDLISMKSELKNQDDIEVLTSEEFIENYKS